MALADFTPATRTITISDGVTFSVRGLSLDDIAVLVRAHFPVLSSLFERYVGEATAAAALEGSEIDVQAIVLDLVETAPDLIAGVIARAADEPTMTDRVKKLPITVLLEAINEIIDLTLKAEGGLGKLMAAIQKLADTLGGAVQDQAA